MSSGANKSEDEQLPENGFNQVVDLLKFTIALATGALVFSAGLLTEDIKLNCGAKFCLFLSWLALATSASAGVLAYMRIPMLIAKRKFNMRDKFMEIPGRIHHISFIVGIISLGVALVIALVKK